jgi:hypothetical protein
MDVVIINLIHTNMVQRTLTLTTHAMMMVIHENTRSYVEWTLSDDFIPFAIETYGCFHYFFDSFLITYA